MGLEKNDRLGTMYTSDNRRSVWYKNYRLHAFLRGARSYIEKKKKKNIMMTKIRISHMSDFLCGETKVRNDP